MNRHIEQLIERTGRGERLKYLLFWGHTPPKDGSINASCLSQWFMRTFSHEGLSFASAEHWMMAGKARTFRDFATLEQILNAPTPGEAKKLGRQVTPFDPGKWDEVKFELVVQGNVLKFGQHADLRDFLLNTGDRVIVEASPRDRIWGIGMGRSNPDAENPAKWRGGNLLGFALMQAREQLRKA